MDVRAPQVCPPRPPTKTFNKPVVGPCADVYKGIFAVSTPPLTAGTSRTAPVSCAGYNGVCVMFFALARPHGRIRFMSDIESTVG